MKKLWLAAILLGGASLATAASAQNWLATTAVTPGGHLMGNPQAPTKLMEFVSYTCPHCGHFFKEANAPIKLLLIQPGKVSVEIHHVIRDPVDYTAVVIAECGDPDKFFGNHEMLFTRQDEWLGKAQAASRSQQQRWYAGSIAQRMQAISADLGFYDLMESRGYSRVDIDLCFNDTKKVEALLKESEDASDKYGVKATPTFVVNGKTLDIYTWDDLQKVLAAKKPTK